MSNNNDFTDGFWISDATNAPEYILQNITINVDRFIPWLQSQQPDERGCVNIVRKLSKAGKPYCMRDDWKPKRPTCASENAAQRERARDAVEQAEQEDTPF